MDNENMNTNEVIEAADQIVEESDGLNVKDVAVLGAALGLAATAGYGIYQLGKKAKAARGTSLSSRLSRRSRMVMATAIASRNLKMRKRST